MDRFPLPETAQYSYQQRFSVQHQGIDIMAPLGTLVLAVADGTAWSTVEPKGGNVVYLDARDGTRYFYGHLDRWSARMLLGSPKVQVQAGDELGYVGNTGNARGGPPHVHFQERVGSLVIDPYPDLQAVDPHRVLPSGVLVLALLWLARR